MKFLLGTGTFNVSPIWSQTWVINNIRHMDLKPSMVHCLAVGGSVPMTLPSTQIEGNLGHVGDLLNGSKPHAFCGWSAGFIQLAMTAYCAELDFIYKEQDCLAFGPWVEQMYKDMGDGNMVFGGKMKSAPYMLSAQSLVLIRHKFIPDFIWRYLGMGKDGDLSNLPETKFGRMLQDEPHHFRALSFGYDRERPINFDDNVFYAQKWTAEELAEAKRRGLI